MATGEARFLLVMFNARNIGYLLSFYLFGRLPQSQCAHEWAFDLVSGADFVRNLHYLPFLYFLCLLRGIVFGN